MESLMPEVCVPLGMYVIDKFSAGSMKSGYSGKQMCAVFIVGIGAGAFFGYWVRPKTPAIRNQIRKLTRKITIL